MHPVEKPVENQCIVIVIITPLLYENRGKCLVQLEYTGISNNILALRLGFLGHDLSIFP